MLLCDGDPNCPCGLSDENEEDNGHCSSDNDVNMSGFGWIILAAIIPVGVGLCLITCLCIWIYSTCKTCMKIERGARKHQVALVPGVSETAVEMTADREDEGQPQPQDQGQAEPQVEFERPPLYSDCGFEPENPPPYESPPSAPAPHGRIL
jgi:hypothetical protein